MPNQTHKRDLKEACITGAYQIIVEQGLGALSLREVARRLSVSHQAPYRHFPSRDHILAEVISKIFGEFAVFLEDSTSNPEDGISLRHMGERYLQYAAQFPLKYQLMFNTPLPDVDLHPNMMAKAQNAFELLEKALSRHRQKPHADLEIEPRADAMFVWSALHGLASILQSDALKTLHMNEQEKAAAISRTFSRITIALGDVLPSDVDPSDVDQDDIGIAGIDVNRL